MVNNAFAMAEANMNPNKTNCPMPPIIKAGVDAEKAPLVLFTKRPLPLNL
jgi:hypothetical protein